MSVDTPEFRAKLGTLITKAVESACSYAGASDSERMAHVIGYLTGHTDLKPVLDRLLSGADYGRMCEQADIDEGQP